jgi:acetoin utilization deacetylase AcuC-like enzyme
MQAYTSDTFVLPLPTGHPFPMDKYRLLREAVQASDWFRRPWPRRANWLSHMPLATSTTC